MIFYLKEIFKGKLRRYINKKLKLKYHRESLNRTGNEFEMTRENINMTMTDGKEGDCLNQQIG